MSDLTADEQKHVRAALNFMRHRCGAWDTLAKAVRVHAKSLVYFARGTRPPSLTVVLRVARLAKVPIDDILTGKFPPPGTCPHCGRGPKE